MLEIKSISKTYKTGSLVQRALHNVSLNLRDNEFVAILGPSGSGKTTLLNIIGGLDRYDSGDLIINGTSTSKYKDRDWDTYRNHTIGFVFQSYNLIPHQTILANVELALTISGLSKRARRQKALKALDEVGLLDQAHKKPNQMSGGQMQRVAIARALVNNPDILLADEPTGALDTKTSIQVMELLKRVAHDRLVVMVTHNPELARDYANRIVQLRDGEILSDSNPYNPETVIVSKKKKHNRKARMGFFTALSLSFNNLLTKKGRTILTAFAGSIGIIGIALILSLSQGFQDYIDKIQEDTLSSYPLTITTDTADMTSAILTMVSDRRENNVEGENVIERQYLSTMFSSIGTNDLKTFKKYIEDNQEEVDQYVSQIRYSYSIVPQIYTIDAVYNLAKLNPNNLLAASTSGSMSLMSSLGGGGGGTFNEIKDNNEEFQSKYKVLKGRWPSNYDELVIVLSEPNSISDLLVYSLGLRDTTELRAIITDLMSQEKVDITNEALTFTYDDLLNIKLKLINAKDTFKYNDKYNIYEDMSQDDKYMRDMYDKSLDLKIVGIVCPDGDNASSAGVLYTKDLTQHVIQQAKNSTIVKAQLRDKDIDVFSGKNFDEANEDNKKSNEELNFEDMISVDEDMIKDAFKINISEDDFADAINPDDITNAASDVVKNIPNKLPSALESINAVYSGAIGGFNTAFTALVKSIAQTNETTDIENMFYAISSSTLIKTVIEKIPNGVVNKDNLTTTLNKTYSEYVSNISALNDDIDPTALTVEMIETEKYQDAVATTCVNVLADVDVQTYITEDAKNLAITMCAGEAIGKCLQDSMSSLGALFDEDIMSVDTDKFAQAFTFDMNQDELSRIMSTMMSNASEKTYFNNLITLGYQDVDNPTNISFYFKDFSTKEKFMDFVDKYNEDLQEEDKLSYTDITGILMSSVKKIVDSVTYVLVAFVSISLVVSSIMIAVITLISVMERTKEIGILRAMGASKRNVSSIFNAETFIIGLLSGLIGVGFTFSVIPFINRLIHSLTDNYDINAVLPHKYAMVLILISVFLTIIAGIIPSRKASKQDPVIALRTE